MYERLEKVIGKSNIDKLSSKTVAVIGLGGVGSYAVEMLARNNIGKIILVDFDIIDISNINRQIEALHSTIGHKKIDELKKRILDINPNIEVILIDKFIDDSNISIIFESNIDYIIDACDTIKTKQLLILECIKRNIKFISCMGTGNKLDPSLLNITTLDKTNYDKLAKIMRKWAKDNKINKKIRVVSSSEKPINTSDRTLGSCSLVPATAGILCASFIINDIINEN